MRNIFRFFAFSLCLVSLGTILLSKNNIKSLLLLPKVTDIVEANVSVESEEEEPTYPFKLSKYTQMYNHGRVYNNPVYYNHNFFLRQANTMSVSDGYIDILLDEEKENITLCCTAHIDATDGDFAFDANSIMYFVFTDGTIVDMKWIKNDYGKMKFGSNINGFGISGVDARAYFYLGGRDRVKTFLTKDMEKMILFNPDKEHITTIEVSKEKVNKKRYPFGEKSIDSFFNNIVRNLETIYVYVMKGHEEVLPIVMYMELENEIREKNNQQ